jgi:hypothetical protein
VLKPKSAVLLTNSGTNHELSRLIGTEVRSRVSPAEFEMAYQARVAMDRIRFAIKHTEQFGQPCETLKEVALQLLDALQRLENADRQFQERTQSSGRQRQEPLR